MVFALEPQLEDVAALCERAELDRRVVGRANRITPAQKHHRPRADVRRPMRADAVAAPAARGHQRPVAGAHVAGTAELRRVVQIRQAQCMAELVAVHADLGDRTGNDARHLGQHGKAINTHVLGRGPWDQIVGDEGIPIAPLARQRRRDGPQVVPVPGLCVTSDTGMHDPDHVDEAVGVAVVARPVDRLWQSVQGIADQAVHVVRRGDGIEPPRAERIVVAVVRQLDDADDLAGDLESPAGGPSPVLRDRARRRGAGIVEERLVEGGRGVRDGHVGVADEQHGDTPGGGCGTRAQGACRFGHVEDSGLEGLTQLERNRARLGRVRRMSRIDCEQDGYCQKGNTKWGSRWTVPIHVSPVSRSGLTRSRPGLDFASVGAASQAILRPGSDAG